MRNHVTCVYVCFQCTQYQTINPWSEQVSVARLEKIILLGRSSELVLELSC